MGSENASSRTLIPLSNVKSDDKDDLNTPDCWEVWSVKLHTFHLPTDGGK